MQTTTVCELVVSFVLVLTTLVNSQFEGDQCVHAKKNQNGICKLLESCPSAIKDLKSGVFPERCGFQGRKVIVCCAEGGSPITSPPPTTTPETARPQITTSQIGDKSKKACKSYEHLSKKTEYDPLGNPFDESICPWQSGVPVIIGGEKSKAGEFPHMALIGYGTLPDNYAWKCGGSLISEKFVLTAAHCLFARGFGEPKFVRLGDLNYTNPNDDAYVQQINIKKLHKNPDYKFPVQYHDIALLELEQPANLNLYVKPACLYVADPGDNIPEAIVTGWGITENDTASEHLLKATVEHFTSDICNRTFENDRRTLPSGIDSRIQICFGSRTSNKDSCQGDSGGPIQVQSKTVHCSYDVFGITSFGKKCGTRNVPAGYVKLTSYIDWIERTVWP